ncbi:MAG: TRAP transporter small permease [Proteobacteria bacterium]|nr:TRAP transporter small permease [Pseudomonadota bacterium]
MSSTGKSEIGAKSGSMRLLDSIERGFLAANRWALCILLAVMATLVFINVVSRYVFNHSFSWVEELTRYMMIWLCFIGAGITLRYGGHIAVDNLQDALPAKGARLLRGLIACIVIGFLGVLVWIGIEYADFGWYQETPIMNISFGMVYLAIPVGCVLTIVHFLFILRRYVSERAFDSDEDFDSSAALL